MIQLISERPVLLALMLGVLAAALIYGWLQSGRKQLAWIGLVIACLIPVQWIVSEKWVTDREQIEKLIYRTADAVEANEDEVAVAVIGDKATREKAAAELSRWVFTQADVGSIRRIDIIENTDPPQADVDIIVKIELSAARGNQVFRVPRRLLLTFEKRGSPDEDGGGWVVTHYEHLPPIGGPDQFSN